MNNIILFGGSFNPITNAHLSIINSARELINATSVIILPTNNYYQKSDLIDLDTRIKLINLAINNTNNIMVSDYEKGLLKSPKSLESLNHFHNEYPSANLYFLMGIDNLDDFKNWYQPKEILANYYLIVIDRAYHLSIDEILTNEVFNGYHHKIIICKAKKEDYEIASSKIRSYLNTNTLLAKSYLNNDVYNYIITNKVY